MKFPDKAKPQRLFSASNPSPRTTAVNLSDKSYWCSRDKRRLAYIALLAKSKYRSVTVSYMLYSHSSYRFLEKKIQHGGISGLMIDFEEAREHIYYLPRFNEAWEGDASLETKRGGGGWSSRR